jgi:hypothetical protein
MLVVVWQLHYDGFFQNIFKVGAICVKIYTFFVRATSIGIDRGNILGSPLKHHGFGVVFHD